MKTALQFLGGLMLLFSLGSCEKDEFESLEPKEIENFNNGMINSYSNEVVLQWNELLSESIDNRLPQPAEVKIYAMVALAMHDALNNVVPKYETYALDNLKVNASDISKKNIHSIANAAVSQAARDMLVQLYPSATATADALLSETLSGIAETDLKTKGIAVGKEAAAAVLAKRANDFPLAFASYSGGTAPGEYRSDYMPFMVANPPAWPANAVYAPNLGNLTPFGIESGDQFRDEAPYALKSEEYIADYNEVKSLGCPNCPLRTEEQTKIGTFWRETSSSSLNRITRTLIAQRKLDGWEATRLISLIQMSVMDAYIASFNEKFYFKFWRPITAIRLGETDGVESTIGDATWTQAFPSIATPPNPQFPSTHAYSAGAAAAIFKKYFKSDHTNLTLTSPYLLPGVERHFTSFSQIAHENSIHGIYLGHDFRYGVVVGERQGRKLGEYVYENNLRELKKVL